VGVPILAISGLPFESPKTKCHLDAGLAERHRVYYKGEGGGFPQVRAVVSLVSLVNPSCPWFILAPKVLQLCTKHLMLVLCKPMWANETCQLFLVPSRNSSTPLYPSKCYEPGSVPQLLALPLFSVWDSHLSPSRNWERVNQALAWILNAPHTSFCHCWLLSYKM